MTTTEETNDELVKVLAVFSAHEVDPHPAVGALRKLLLAYAQASRQLGDMLTALGYLKGEGGEGNRLAALRALGVPRVTLERLLAEGER